MKFILTAEQLAEKMKIDIVDDVAAGIVPITVKSFGELHDYVDANMYGDTMDIVHAWIEGGGVGALVFVADCI